MIFKPYTYLLIALLTGCNVKQDTTQFIEEVNIGNISKEHVKPITYSASFAVYQMGNVQLDIDSSFRLNRDSSINFDIYEVSSSEGYNFNLYLGFTPDIPVFMKEVVLEERSVSDDYILAGDSSVLKEVVLASYNKQNSINFDFGILELSSYNLWIQKTDSTVHVLAKNDSSDLIQVHLFTDDTSKGVLDHMIETGKSIRWE